jgi:DNA polymerase-3 subunit epsilon
MASFFRELMATASETTPIKYLNPSKEIVLDTETTGLVRGFDEIIKISIIDGDGNTLINELVHPYKQKEWKEASDINHIYPDDLIHAPYPHELIADVKGIIESADTIIAYNADFDLGFLKYWGIQTENKIVIDVMTEFAIEFGEWSSYFDDYKWQKLTTCADYYGYDFKPHDSMEDVKATLFCYKKMHENE